MLKRETFIGAICAIQKQEQLTDQINQIYNRMTSGLGNFEMDGLIHAALIQTLEDGMEDESGTVSWWLYDAPKDSKTISWEENGRRVAVDLRDVNDLYDYLVRCAEERKEAST